MTLPLWSVEMAQAFWDHAGITERPPRNLRIPIANALPLSIVLLPKLHVEAVGQWFRNRRIPFDSIVRDRALRACLVARFDHGVIFLDGADPDDEQRFSLAHELAHFLRGYWYPRRKIVEQLGISVLEVLDGERPPQQDERIHSVLTGISLGFHIHLMDRSLDGAILDSRVSEAEYEADVLAFELLAPSTEVADETCYLPANERRIEAAYLLSNTYGFPADAAQRYASILYPPTRPTDSLLSRLGLVS